MLHLSSPIAVLCYIYRRLIVALFYIYCLLSSYVSSIVVYRRSKLHLSLSIVVLCYVYRRPACSYLSTRACRLSYPLGMYYTMCMSWRLSICIPSSVREGGQNPERIFNCLREIT
jgi:hypothetical protein